MRKLLLSSIGIVVLIAIVIYFLFFRTTPTVVITPTGNVGLPIAEQSSENISSGAADVTQNHNNVIVPAFVSDRLVQISTDSVVPGEAVVSTGMGTSVNFIARSSGNVFSYDTASKTLTRTGNKTILGVQSAKWSSDGSVALVRFLSGDNYNTINTYELSATSSDGFFLAQDLTDVDLFGNKILTLASGVNGSVASLLNLQGSQMASVFTTPLSSLHVTFAGVNRYLAFTKPSASVSGYAFMVDSTGHFSRVAGPKNGLVALPSPSGNWLLVSYTVGGTMQMQLVNTGTNQAIQLPVATIADKCVWTADETSIYCGIPENPDPSYAYPDDWYQGAVHFSDRIWKIDVSGRFASLVVDFSKENVSVPVDVTALAIDPTNTTLVFLNKNDGTLWGYSL